MERFLEVLGSIADIVIFIICDNRGELRFDELKNQWIYTDGKSKTKLIIVDHFDENGKTFSELLLSALVYEANQMDKSAKTDEKNDDEENE